MFFFWCGKTFDSAISSLSCIVDFSDDLKHTQIKSTDKKKHTTVFHKRNTRYNRGLYLTVH